jgi:hypothetical protein
VYTILLGTDYPFEDMTASVRLLEGLDLSSDYLSPIWEAITSSCGIVTVRQPSKYQAPQVDLAPRRRSLHGSGPNISVALSQES